MTTANSGRSSELTLVYSANSASPKIISTSTGMARKNSTTIETGMRTQAWSESRAMPRTAPSGSAMTIASAAALRVFSRPGQMYVDQGSVLVKNISHWTHSSWPLSFRVLITHHTTATTAARKTTVRTTLRRLARGPWAS
ncbi:hypothetical protein SFUMM280S_02705 [Streptomyces fumanus]